MQRRRASQQLLRRDANARAPVYALLLGDLVSQLGNALTAIALPWFVLVTTGSATKMGLVFFLSMLPVPITAVLGGGLVDRVGPKRVSVVSDLVSGVSVALIPLLHLTIGLAFWQLLVLALCGAVLDGPGLAARRSLVPQLAERAGMRLERANAGVQGTLTASVMLGPVVAGLLVVALGAGNVLWIDAATFAISALAVALVVPEHTPGRTQAGWPAAGFGRELREGIAFVWSDRLLTHLLASSAVTIAIIGALLTLVVPVYAVEVFGSPVQLGLLAAGFGAGSLLGSVGFGVVGHWLPRWTTFVAATALVGLPLWGLADLPPLLAAVASLAVVGLAFGALLPVLDTMLQERTPPELRGRVFGIRVAVVNGIKPLGVLLVGVLLEGVGLRATLLIVAATSLATSVTLVTLSGLRAPKPINVDGEPAAA